MELLVSSGANLPRSRWLLAHAIAVFSFLYLPIAVLILYSFNGQGVGGFPPHHLTFDWYRLLFNDAPIWDSVLNSLQVAFAAMAISLMLGIPAALALDRAQFPGKAMFRRLVLLPLILPGIITGLSLLMFAVFAGMKLSLFGASYNWPPGAAISLAMLVIVVSLLFLSERLEKKWSFS